MAENENSRDRSNDKLDPCAVSGRPRLSRLEPTCSEREPANWSQPSSRSRGTCLLGYLVTTDFRIEPYSLPLASMPCLATLLLFLVRVVLIFIRSSDKSFLHYLVRIVNFIPSTLQRTDRTKYAPICSIILCHYSIRGNFRSFHGKLIRRCVSHRVLWQTRR